ncbi:MAG: hypothetical protein LKG11_06280 [Bacilli bacterium]|jgi:hypothetical protein|nr:hypothetical protein [Bacilli bacterium]
MEMEDFDGKVIKVTLNSSYGVVCATGPFVKIENNFLVMINSISEKIEYYSLYYVKTIMIMGDIDPDDFSRK